MVSVSLFHQSIHRLSLFLLTDYLPPSFFSLLLSNIPSRLTLKLFFHLLYLLLLAYFLSLIPCMHQPLLVLCIHVSAPHILLVTHYTYVLLLLATQNILCIFLCDVAYISLSFRQASLPLLLVT